MLLSIAALNFQHLLVRVDISGGAKVTFPKDKVKKHGTALALKLLHYHVVSHQIVPDVF